MKLLLLLKSTWFWLGVGVVLFLIAQFTEIEIIGYIGIGLIGATSLWLFFNAIKNWIKDMSK